MLILPVNLCLVKLCLVKWCLVKFLGGLILLTFFQLSHAQTETLPLDLIELLGELDDEDDALNTALTEVELKKSKETTQPNEVKK